MIVKYIEKIIKINPLHSAINSTFRSNNSIIRQKPFICENKEGFYYDMSSHSKIQYFII